MIVKIFAGGSSFKKTADYLTHDRNRETDERVAWTHTHNLTCDDIPGAVNEMYLTAENAELLKQEAGIRPGGRSVENTVKNLSLNWSPEESPTREHMIATSEEFLRHMGWEEHQAIFVAHTDRPHPHVHLEINVIHPVTGLALDDSFERRRAQAWALEYEIENGKILCPQRPLNATEREKSPPRNIWLAFHDSEKEFSRAEKLMAENTEIKSSENPKFENSQKNTEWENLKAIQRDERTGWFASGKIEFKELRNSIYREIREEYRDRWAEYYNGKENGAEPSDLAQIKAGIVADQKAELESRRDIACKELLTLRKEQYQELLGDQRLMREGLRARQEAGFDNELFLQAAEDRTARYYLHSSFREATTETTRQADRYETSTRAVTPEAEPAHAISARSSEDIGLNVGISPLSLFDGFFTELTNLGSAKPEPAPRDVGLAAAASEVTAKEQQRARNREKEEDEQNEKQRSR